ncbi:MAG: ABC transporter substrate-binding protein [Alistipes sp.]|jgi:iron complex transport system substrate-binding protein|nr:ABC transporter substrate-binding protein [Alistipes sp.]
MKKSIIIIFTLFAAAAFWGCGAKQPSFVPGEPVYTPRHARGFAVFEAGERSAAIRVTDPWQGAEGFEQWVFVPGEGEAAPVGFEGVVLAGAPRRVICMSSSYTAFMGELGAADRIVGVSGAQFITDSLLATRHRVGDVADVGYDNNLDFERIAALRPDLMLVYGVRDGGATEKLRHMGIPCVLVGEYLEESPLGKAEWMVALGEMFGVRQAAEARFARIERDYDQLASVAAGGGAARGDGSAEGGSAEGVGVGVGDGSAVGGSAGRPKVMFNAPYRDVWYAPGDLNYMVRLVEDAGGEYVCGGVESRDSRPIDIEEAYVAMRTADVWLHTNHYSTLGALLGDNPRFADTPPVVSGRVYNNNARTTPGGGSDFWESGVVRPDRVLRDLMLILHPELFGVGEVPYYYKRLQ